MKATLPCAKIDTTGWIHSIKTGILEAPKTPRSVAHATSDPHPQTETFNLTLRQFSGITMPLVG